jgi:hypothetical protein
VRFINNEPKAHITDDAHIAILKNFSDFETSGMVISQLEAICPF